jgi:hypothetical protein
MGISVVYPAANAAAWQAFAVTVTNVQADSPTPRKSSAFRSLASASRTGDPVLVSIGYFRKPCRPFGMLEKAKNLLPQ